MLRWTSASDPKRTLAMRHNLVVIGRLEINGIQAEGSTLAI
jgi:hypothetical protein